MAAVKLPRTPNRAMKASSSAVQSRIAAAVKLAVRSNWAVKFLSFPVQSGAKIILSSNIVNRILTLSLWKSVDGCAKCSIHLLRQRKA